MDGCVEKLVSHVSKRKTVVLSPVADLAQDQVNSVACLSIGQGNVFRGQENKDLYLSYKMPTLFHGSTDCLDILLFVRLPVYRGARVLYRT